MLLFWTSTILSFDSERTNVFPKDRLLNFHVVLKAIHCLYIYKKNNDSNIFFFPMVENCCGKSIFQSVWLFERLYDPGPL